VTGVKTNERPGTRAVLRHSRVSAYKAREVLDLIRGQDYGRATEILEYCERGVAEAIGKLLNSAAANARHNDGLEPEEMYVSACFADEGATLKRWRPRARGRATDPSVFGQEVTFNMTITGVNGVIPTGSLTLTDNGNPLSVATIDPTGKAAFTTSTLTAGPHDVEVVYSGDQDYR